MNVKEMQQSFNRPSNATERTLGQTVFNRTEHNNKPSMSVEDTVFLKIMDTNIYRDNANSWFAPLPFREPHQHFPNKLQVAKWFASLQQTLKMKPEMQEQYVAFMEKIVVKEHIEVALPLTEEEEFWYLSMCGVYHPLKPSQIRVSFLFQHPVLWCLP